MHSFPLDSPTLNPMVGDSESWHFEISSLWQKGCLVYSEPWIQGYGIGICPIQTSAGLVENWMHVGCLLSSKTSPLLSGPHYCSSFFWAAKTQPSGVAPWKKMFGVYRKATAGASHAQGCTWSVVSREQCSLKTFLPHSPQPQRPDFDK